MAIAKRKKRFWDVEIPLIHKDTQLQSYERESLNGKFIKHDLTRLLRGKNNLLLLKVVADKEKAVAYPMSLQLLPSFLKRVVRKGTNYVEDSFSTDCKDATLKIKPFIVTRRKVSRVVRKALREKAKEELINYVKKKDKDTLFDEILKNQLQKHLSLKLKKVYPLSLCEIRVFKVQKEFEAKPEEKKKEEVKEKVEEVKEEKASSKKEKKEVKEEKTE